MKRAGRTGRTTPKRQKCVPGCGRCCHPVTLPFNQFEAALRTDLPARSLRWILEDLTPMAPETAFRLAPYLFLRPTKVELKDGTLVDAPNHFYRCRNFDPGTKTCAIYEDRPDTCRNYPWYGRKPNDAAALPPECGYNVDVGRQPVPITLSPKPR